MAKRGKPEKLTPTEKVRAKLRQSRQLIGEAADTLFEGLRNLGFDNQMITFAIVNTYDDNNYYNAYVPKIFGEKLEAINDEFQNLDREWEIFCQDTEAYEHEDSDWDLNLRSIFQGLNANNISLENFKEATRLCDEGTEDMVRDTDWCSYENE